MEKGEKKEGARKHMHVQKRRKQRESKKKEREKDYLVVKHEDGDRGRG